jgi:hypothetical protein
MLVSGKMSTDLFDYRISIIKRLAGVTNQVNGMGLCPTGQGN